MPFLHINAGGNIELHVINTIRKKRISKGENILRQLIGETFSQLYSRTSYSKRQYSREKISFLKCITIQCKFLLIITAKYSVCSVGILKINFVKICFLITPISGFCGHFKVNGHFLMQIYTTCFPMFLIMKLIGVTLSSICLTICLTC